MSLTLEIPDQVGLILRRHEISRHYSEEDLAQDLAYASGE